MLETESELITRKSGLIPEKDFFWSIYCLIKTKILVIS